MKTQTIEMEWKNTFEGIMHTPNGNIQLGDVSGGQQPYHLLYGALGSCFYATFLSIATKKRCQFDRATITINGEKRDTEPATLSHVTIDFTIYNPSNQEQLLKSAQLGAKFCSIHETISQVAHIDLNVVFA